jgi:hypothetical protein
MTRRNAPRLIDPMNDVLSGTDGRLGIVSTHDLLARIEALERTIARMNDDAQRRLPIDLPYERVPAPETSFATPLILTTFNLKGAATGTNVTSTTGTTITNSNIGPLVLGIPYLVIAMAFMAITAPAGQTIYACVRIEAGGTTVDGTQTALSSGERDGVAIDFKTVMGTGSSINIAGRARVTSGTGVVNDALSIGIAIPLGAMIEV